MDENKPKKEEKMKKVLILSTFFMFCSAAVFAGPYDAFNWTLNNAPTESIAQDYLDAFAKDVGQAIAGGSYGVGAGLGSLGVYLSIKMSYQQVSNDDRIVRNSGEDSIIYPIVQGEIRLPYKFDAILRISNMNETTLLGGGLRYEVLEGRDLIIPTVSAQSVYNYLIADSSEYKFNAWNLKTGVTAFFGEIPVIQPYVFVSFDVTGLKPISSDYSNLSSQVYGAGYGIGANLSLGMLNITGSISMYDSQPNYNFGLFIGI